jgi:hypothetical protein
MSQQLTKLSSEHLDVVQQLARIKLEKVKSLRRTIIKRYNKPFIYDVIAFALHLPSRCPTPRIGGQQVPDTFEELLESRNQVHFNQWLLPYQQLAYYCSSLNNLGLSILDLVHLPLIPDLPTLLQKYHISKDIITSSCPICLSKLSDNQEVCDKCLTLLEDTIEYRIGDFIIPVVNIRPFITKVKHYNISGFKDKILFEETTISTKRYQKKLPFIEYVRNLLKGF